MTNSVIGNRSYTFSSQDAHWFKKGDLLNRPIKDIFANFYGSLGKMACLENWNQLLFFGTKLDQCASTRRNPVLTKCSDLWWKKGCVTLEKAPGEYLVYKIYGVFPWDSLYFMGQYLSFLFLQEPTFLFIIAVCRYLVFIIFLNPTYINVPVPILFLTIIWQRW